MITAKANVQDMLKPYAPKEVKIYDQWTRMDRNESLFGVAPKVKEAIVKELDFISRYPENTAWQLRTSLANYYGVHEDQLLIGNGSYELIWLISSVCLDDQSDCVVTEPSFIWYNIYGKLLGKSVNVVKYKDFQLDLNEVLATITSKTKVVWLCNPNNPIGNYIDTATMREFLAKVPKDIVVCIDEAYMEFMDNYTPRESLELVDEFENVVILRTFSKFYGLASMRIGYAIGSKEFMNTLFQFRIPPNHSRMAEVAAKASIEDVEFQNQVRATVKEERAFLYASLEGMGIKYMPTQTNFMLLYLGDKVEAVVNALQKEHILVKSGKEFGLEGWIRLSIGNRAANSNFINIVGRTVGKTVK